MLLDLQNQDTINYSAQDQKPRVSEDQGMHMVLRSYTFHILKCRHVECNPDEEVSVEQIETISCVLRHQPKRQYSVDCRHAVHHEAEGQKTLLGGIRLAETNQRVCVHDKINWNPKENPEFENGEFFGLHLIQLISL